LTDPFPDSHNISIARKDTAMSQPAPDIDSLSHWKLRLLERIQDTAADHTRVLAQGYPIHAPQHGSTQIPIQIWRTHLRALDSERADIEIHAAAVGVPASAIAQARTAGQRGQRWDHSVHTPPTLRHGGDPVRTQTIDSIAGDVWQLEHMAALSVEYQRRSIAGLVPPAPELAEQLQRNMNALWSRAAAGAHVLNLTPLERAALWERDNAGWQRLTEASVHRYDDPQLQERWRAHAWRGIELDAVSGLDNLSATPSHTQRAATPPTPQQMIQRATEALAEPRVVPDNSASGREADVEMAAGRGEAWVFDPAEWWDDPPDPHPPEPHSVTEHGL